MKIIIKNSSEDNWYKKFIGKEFEVTSRIHPTFKYLEYILDNTEQNRSYFKDDLTLLFLRDGYMGVKHEHACKLKSEGIYMKKQPNHEELYQEFWKTLVEDEEGKVVMGLVKRELADYKILLEEVPKVYDELAGFSKPHTRASVIISAVNERMIDKQMAYDDLTMTAQDGEVTLTVARLKEYFDIQ